MFSLQVIIREVHTAIDLGYCDGFLSSSDAEVPPPLPPEEEQARTWRAFGVLWLHRGTWSISSG